ncbi:hypothetical protein [Leuconostoc gelidum]|uniref:hypothetical protein n=1 Tax=Leuconostoc gelidum TaxID=1244 RepID=UPI001CC6EE86|nr:hypothetical protein [Leuconostoc gelidum]MBZ6001562.1 hypothetical protein [Leuconostoc gelidum subsp. gelidum]
MINNQLFDFGRKIYLSFFGIGMFLIIFSTSKFQSANILTNNANKVALFIAIALVGISILYAKVYSRGEIYFIVTVMIIGTVTSYLAKGLEPVMMSFYIISSRRINPYDILKVLFIVNIMLFITNFMLFKAGILLDYQNFSISKHSFGYNHPNQMGISVFSVITISMVFFYQKRKSQNIIKYLLLLFQIPLLLLIQQSGSRGAQIATIITYLILIYLLFTRNREHSILLFLMSISVLIVSLLFSLYTMSDSVNTVGSFLYNLNQLFTQRVQLNNYFFDNYGFNFFGQNVSYNLTATVSTNYAIIDNAYVKLVINYGVIYTVFYLGYIIFLVREIISKKQVILLMPMLSFMVYGLVEQGFLQYWVNFSMLFGGIFYAIRKSQHE